MYIFFISPFFVLIYTPVEMNKNMIKTRTYKNTSQKLKGENWSRRGETEGSRFDVLKGIRHNFFLDNKCPYSFSTLLNSQNHCGVTVLYRVSIGFYKRHKKWSLSKIHFFKGSFKTWIDVLFDDSLGLVFAMGLGLLSLKIESSRF